MKDMKRNTFFNNALINVCSEGVVSYFRIFSAYELSYESRDILSDILRASLKQWAENDPSIRSEIADYYSEDRGILEKNDFYKWVFNGLIRRPEFVNSVAGMFEEKVKWIER